MKITKHQALIGLPIAAIVFIGWFEIGSASSFTHRFGLLNFIFNRSNASRQPNHQRWNHVYEGLRQNKPLTIEGMNDVLISNSMLENIEDHDAIVIKDSNNVYIDNVVINRLSGKNNLSGIRIHNSTNVIIANSVISRITSRRHSAAIKITGSKSANIIIDGNHIYQTYGNGIVSDGCSDCAATQTIHDTPVPGLKITNNLIHDTGLTPTPKKASPTHGMYIKAQDAYIAGNEVYNAFDGQGISIRSTAIVRNNKVWDTRLAAVGFLQMKPPGSSQQSVIEDNELFFTENKPKSLGTKSLLFLNWSHESSYPLRYENFVVRHNKLAICSAEAGDIPIIKLYPFNNLIIAENKLIDRRKNQQFFGYLENSKIDYEKSHNNYFSSANCPQAKIK